MDSVTIGAAGLIFLLAVIVVPVSHFRSRGQITDAQILPRLAIWTLWLASALNLAFLVGAWIHSKQALAKNYGWETLVGFSPSSSRYLFLLPWLTSLLALGLLVFTVLAWKNRWWRRPELVAFSLGKLAVLSLTGILIYRKVISI